jgi:hypothetical protein
MPIESVLNSVAFIPSGRFRVATFCFDRKKNESVLKSGAVAALPLRAFQTSPKPVWQNNKTMSNPRAQLRATNINAAIAAGVAMLNSTSFFTLASAAYHPGVLFAMGDEPYLYCPGVFDIYTYYQEAPSNFQHDFRFPADDFMVLPTLLGMDSVIQLENKRVFDSRFALAVALHRLGKNDTETSMSRLFGVDRTTINRITNKVRFILYFGLKIRLNRNQLDSYVDRRQLRLENVCRGAQLLTRKSAHIRRSCCGSRSRVNAVLWQRAPCLWIHRRLFSPGFSVFYRVHLHGFSYMCSASTDLPSCFGPALVILGLLQKPRA